MAPLTTQQHTSSRPAGGLDPPAGGSLSCLESLFRKGPDFGSGDTLFDYSESTLGILTSSANLPSPSNIITGLKSITLTVLPPLKGRGLFRVYIRGGRNLGAS